MLNLIIGPAIDLAKDFIKGKADEKKAIQERKIATIQNDADWEAKMASGAEKSWKDEWFSVLLSLPLIGVAYSVIVDDPQIISRVNEGFAALSQLPEWYQYLLFIAVSASFGLKSADKIMNLRNKK
jgi:hypothetical protein|tara:strand:+ start:141 stop:518 length:378 start_codon:yes stop_codon:yes gene_type:complete